MPARSTHSFGTLQRARKEYTCDKCKGTIYPGQHYFREPTNWGAIIKREHCGICMVSTQNQERIAEQPEGGLTAGRGMEAPPVPRKQEARE